MVDAGILPHFSRLLSRPLIKANYEILEQIVWCIGNILGDGHELRNTLIEKGIADRIVNIIVHNSKELPISCIRNLSWAISNLTRNKEVPVDLDVVVKWLPAFHILLDYEDVTAKIDAIWGISYLLDSGDSEIQMIMESGFFPVILPLLEHSDSSIRNAALRSVGTILSGADPHTQVYMTETIFKYWFLILAPTLIGNARLECIELFKAIDEQPQPGYKKRGDLVHFKYLCWKSNADINGPRGWIFPKNY